MPLRLAYQSIIFMHALTKKISLFIAFALSAGPIPALSAKQDVRDDNPPPLLIAGIFRIESERSYKLSLQLSLKIVEDQARKERDRALAKVARMRQDLAGLSEKSPKTARAFKRANAALDDQIAGLQKLSIANAAVMYDVNEDLLNKLNALSFALESETDDTSSRIVALALRQASLAQRMAKIVLLRSLDKSLAARQGFQVDLAQSKNEFANGLGLLSTEAASNRLLHDRITLANQQWLFYDSALTSAGTDPAALPNISTTSDRIAELMIEIVRISYAQPLDISATSRN